MRHGRWVAVVLFIALATFVGFRSVSEGGTSAIMMRDAWTRPTTAAQAARTPQNALAAMMGGSNSVVYLTIANTGDGADKLTGVQSAVAGAVEMHRMAIKENVATMRQVNAIEIPKGSEVRLDPNGYHLILVNVRRDLKVGDTVDLTLTFEHAGPIQVSAQVRDQ